MSRMFIISISLWMTIGECIQLWSTQTRFASSVPLRKPKIYLVTSVIWEGDHLQDHNVNAIKKLRALFPDQNLTHFISPAYFLHGATRGLEVRKIFQSVFRSDDDFGLVMHGWKSLAVAAGVVFRNEKTFWGQPVRPQDCLIDCGKDTELDQYSDVELEKLFVTAKNTLNPQNGIPKDPKNLLVAGWLATPSILNAARKNGFLRDYSAISPSSVYDDIGMFPLAQKLSLLWDKQIAVVSPRIISTPSGSMLEVGNNGAMADYHDVEQTVAMFRNYVTIAAQDSSQDLVFHYGLHQETAFQNLSRFTEVLKRIVKMAAENHVELSDLPNLAPQPMGASQKILAKSAH